MGYSPKEEREKISLPAQKRLPVGTIPIDAFFSPVRNVSYEIENMRVGGRTDYDRLFLTIETDGIMTPEEALQEGVKILIAHFSVFVSNDNQEGDGKIEKEVKTKLKKKIKKDEKTKKGKKV